jgi:uncharacterized protein (TIGR02301 family)
MRVSSGRLVKLGFGALALAAATMVLAPVAEAQFWQPWFEQAPRPRPRVKPAPPPGDDLPPIVPKEESSVPPPPDDRPYDSKLLRLAEILGAVHYLRELCGAQEGQLWREQMKDILKNEGTTAVRRAKLVNSFNDGYRGYRRTYRTCAPSATLAVTRFSTEGAQIAAALAAPSHFASRGPTNDASAAQGNQATGPENNKPGSPQADQGKQGQVGKSSTPQGDQAKPGQANKATSPQADAGKPGAQATPPAKPGRVHHPIIPPAEPSGF